MIKPGGDGNVIKKNESGRNFAARDLNQEIKTASKRLLYANLAGKAFISFPI